MTKLIQESTLTAIGDAIRAKTGSAELMSPSAMATAIAGIETGGGGGSSADLSAQDLRNLNYINKRIGGVAHEYYNPTSTLFSLTTDAYSFLSYDKTLTSVNLPNMPEMSMYALAGCENLASVNLDSLTYLRDYMFEYGIQNTSTPLDLKLPSVTQRDSTCSYAFRYCYGLRSIYMPNYYRTYDDISSSGASESMFYYCSNLESVLINYVYQLGSTTKSYAPLYNCKNIKRLVITDKLNAPVMAPYLNEHQYGNTNPFITGDAYFYVPASMVSTYQNASNWKTHYADHIRAIEDYKDELLAVFPDMLADYDWEY